MKLRIFLMRTLLAATLGIVLAGPAAAGEKTFHWTTVVNNNDLIPPLYIRNFNSYNQPSVNASGMVVMRARSRGGPPLGPATHGIYTRDMSIAGTPIVRILDRTSLVPKPNNLGTTFVETPSFPRIDIDSDTIATRGNHQPVHRYVLDDGSESRAGTTGIYTNPYGELVTGHAKLGHVPGMERFRVPEFNGINFEVFPGSPAVTETNTIVFKGNFTAAGFERTGVYYRSVEPGDTGGDALTVLIANSVDTLIPGTNTVFGSTAPPSAAHGKAVFAGFDNEWAPTLGGIYLANLEFQPQLSALAEIGQAVPGLEEAAFFNDFGEALAFDGRFVGFWAAWGEESRTVRLYCPQEGNKDRIAYCNQALVCRDTGETRGDPESICNDADDPNYGTSCYTERNVPVHQGIFVHDLRTDRTYLVKETADEREDFLFWNYAGKTPCAGMGHSEEGGEDDGESVRWRSSAFVAVSGRGAAYRAAFKVRSRTNDEPGVAAPTDAIYVAKGPGRSQPKVVLATTMDGQTLDPQAPPGSRILELGLEREGFRGHWLAVSAKMGVEGGEEEDDMAGVYIARIY
jgi:hypothetical protein